MKNNNLRSPIIQHDRDWEVLSKLAKTKLKAKDDIEVYNILKEYDRHNIKLDAETFVEFCMLVRKRRHKEFPSYWKDCDLCRQAVINRLGYQNGSYPQLKDIYPEILLSGDHAKIDAWRKEQSKKKTEERRPDLLK